MLIFYSLILLIVATIIANIFYTNFPSIPLTFYQIGCGLLLSLLPVFQNYSLEPEIFMLMVIAPLMFKDGQVPAAIISANQFAKFPHWQFFWQLPLL